MMRRYLIAMAILLSAGTIAPAWADPLFDACEAKLAKRSVPDSEFGSCGGAWVDRAEKRLAAAWSKALHDAGGAQSEQGHALLDAQRAWITFKDRACLSYEVQTAGTISRFHDASICLAEVIEDRIDELTGDLHGKKLS